MYLMIYGARSDQLCCIFKEAVGAHGVNRCMLTKKKSGEVIYKQEHSAGTSEKWLQLS